MTEKRCPICREVKGRDAFYVTSKGVWSGYCKACTSGYNAARRVMATANRPPKAPKPPKPPVPCAYEHCDKDATTLFNKNGKDEGPYCAVHYNQRWRGKELTPVNEYQESYINERVRHCTSCDRVLPQTAFYTRTNGKAQSICRRCANLVSSFNQALRKGQYMFALSLTERMPERMKEKMMRRYADAINSRSLECSNAGTTGGENDE